MKKSKTRVVAVILAAVFLFSAAGVGGTYAIKSAVSKNVTTLDDGSAVIEVNSMDEAIDLMAGSPAFAGNTAEVTAYGAPAEEIVPTIILPGISQSVSYLADENGNPVKNADGDELSGGLLIIDSSTLPQILLGTLFHPLVKSLVLQKNVGLSEAVYSTVQQVFATQATDKNGNAINNLQTETYDYPISQMSYADKQYFYRMIPMKPITNYVPAADPENPDNMDWKYEENFKSTTNLISEDDLYLYAFPLIGDPIESGAKLNDYIQMVKEQRGCDKVNIVTISLGGTILTSYLDQYDGSDINRIVNVVSCLQGTDIMGDFFMRNFNLDDEFLFNEFIPMIFEESEGYGTYGYLINVLLKIFPKQVVYDILTAAVDGIIDTLMLNCPQFWSMIPTDRFDDVMAKYSFIQTDPEYAQLYAKVTRFQQAKLNLEDNLEKINSEKGVLVQNVSGYNMTYGEMDYCFFGIMASSSTTNSDGVIDVDSSSLGATYVPARTVLAADYSPVTDGFISPEGSIDASTCLFPEHVWFFQGQYHEVGRNDVVLNLVHKLITGEIKSTADEAGVYPQFNGNRNTKNITRWYLDEVNKFFNDSENFHPENFTTADIDELNAAKQEALDLLATTICEPTAAEATQDRLLNALRRVGVREAEKDTKTDEALEAVCKFLNDTIYTVFGGNGFSDWKNGGILIGKDK